MEPVFNFHRSNSCRPQVISTDSEPTFLAQVEHECYPKMFLALLAHVSLCHTGIQFDHSLLIDSLTLL